MPCNKFELDEHDRQTVLSIAKQSIEYGLQNNMPLPIEPLEYPQSLQQITATFVTLNHHGQLRGCIGTLQAQRPLISDVAEHAFAAAFRDPRFSPLTKEEFSDIEVHISLLTTPEELKASSEKELLQKLRPGVDGLILQDDWHQATFLPSVWQQLPDATQFLHHLKEKAGLPGNYWSDELRFKRYYAVSIEY